MTPIRASLALLTAIAASRPANAAKVFSRATAIDLANGEQQG